MVRLDRTIGLPKLALTDLFVPMVRSIPRLDRGRTMTKGEGATRSSHYFSEYGVEHEDEATGASRPNVGVSAGSHKIRTR